MTYKIGTTLAVLYGLTSLAPTAAHADYVYDYVGGTFDYGNSQGSTYTPVTKNLVATIDSASALAANTTYTFGTGLSPDGSFSIGLGAATCTGYQCLNYASITTNSIGAISSWSLSILGGASFGPTITGSSTAATYFSGYGPLEFGSIPLFDALVINNNEIGPNSIAGSTTPRYVVGRRVTSSFAGIRLFATQWIGRNRGGGGPAPTLGRTRGLPAIRVVTRQGALNGA